MSSPGPAADLRWDPVGDPGARPRELLGEPGRPFFLTGTVTWVFIPVSIGALAGVTERDAGVAAGLIDSSQQLGGAIGIAVASTVVAARSRVLLGRGHAIADALTGGFHWAFWVCGLVGLTAVPVVFLLVRRTEIAQAAAAATQRKAPAPAAALTAPGATPGRSRIADG